jgi:pyruvate/2-oxoglutarate dehydrogenase complex dihydrolipoamide acyltransferase (E2) component
MENNTQKNIIFLVLAGVVLTLVNGGVFVAAGKGQLAPIDNLALWGAFAVLNICSLLWAISLLGLQPLVVAFSYVAGGALAFMGVRMIPDVNVAEITTAGATYAAFGALAVGNATTRVRFAFFNKAQVPFIFIILVLLLLDGLLNSQVSKAGMNVILNALVFPFVFSGAVVGLVWSLLVRSGIGKNMDRAPVEAVAESSTKETQKKAQERPASKVANQATAREANQERKLAEAKALAARKAEEANKVLAARKAEEAKALAAQKAEEAKALAARKAEEARALAAQKAEEARALAARKAEEAKALAEQRKIEEARKMEAARKAEEARVLAERKAAAEEAATKKEEVPFFPLEIENLEDLAGVSEKDTAQKDAPKPKGDDWLNSHMDLLNEITKES